MTSRFCYEPLRYIVVEKSLAIRMYVCKRAETAPSSSPFCLRIELTAIWRRRKKKSLPYCLRRPYAARSAKREKKKRSKQELIRECAFPWNSKSRFPAFRFTEHYHVGLIIPRLEENKREEITRSLIWVDATGKAPATYRYGYQQQIPSK